MNPGGVHIVADFFDCDGATLDDSSAIAEALTAAATAAGATLVSQHVHPFSPCGVTGVAILAESHLAIHTWPEHRYAAIDIFTCGDVALPARAIDELGHLLLPTTQSRWTLVRGSREVGFGRTEPEVTT